MLELGDLGVLGEDQVEEEAAGVPLLSQGMVRCAMAWWWPAVLLLQFLAGMERMVAAGCFGGGGREKGLGRVVLLLALGERGSGG